jgi:hypothetical protein
MNRSQVGGRSTEALGATPHWSPTPRSYSSHLAWPRLRGETQRPLGAFDLGHYRPISGAKDLVIRPDHADVVQPLALPPTFIQRV